MNTRILFGAVAASVMAFGFAASAQANCESSYGWQYGGGQPHRAFAMTTSAAALHNHNHGIAFSCGWAVNQPNRSVAIKLAMARCESARARRDERGACRVINSQ